MSKTLFFYIYVTRLDKNLKILYTISILRKNCKDAQYRMVAKKTHQGGEGGEGMKSTGIVRKVDELGRIVLPIELRKVLHIEVRDALEIFVDEGKIILKKYEPADIFTGSMEDLIEYKGKKVSKQSVVEMAKQIGLN